MSFVVGVCDRFAEFELVLVGGFKVREERKLDNSQSAKRYSRPTLSQANPQPRYAVQVGCSARVSCPKL
jgi:hypothetical protein